MAEQRYPISAKQAASLRTMVEAVELAQRVKNVYFEAVVDGLDLPPEIRAANCAIAETNELTFSVPDIQPPIQPPLAAEA